MNRGQQKNLPEEWVQSSWKLLLLLLFDAELVEEQSGINRCHSTVGQRTFFAAAAVELDFARKDESSLGREHLYLHLGETRNCYINLCPLRKLEGLCKDSSLPESWD